MNGIELAERFYLACGRELIERTIEGAVDRIAVGLVTESDDIRAAATQYGDYVKGETLAVELAFEPIEGAEPAAIKIDGADVAVYVAVK